MGTKTAMTSMLPRSVTAVACHPEVSTGRGAGMIRSPLSFPATALAGTGRLARRQHDMRVPLRVELA
uniref:Uncharacterized protein n=1 Tax=Streptomyces sp. HK1 TaxID=405041 RepID=B0LU18_9ACTN|nr:unknown [Streptomyces sp. HK1]